MRPFDGLSPHLLIVLVNVSRFHFDLSFEGVDSKSSPVLSPQAGRSNKNGLNLVKEISLKKGERLRQCL